MAVHKWKDIVEKRHGKGSYERLRAEAHAEFEHDPFLLNVAALRAACGLSPEEIEAVEAKLFEEDDYPSEDIVASLRRYVEALGGELEVIARFGDKTVKLHGV
jgi:hypothetical protein